MKLPWIEPQFMKSTLPQDQQAVQWYDLKGNMKKGIYLDEEEMFFECEDPMNPTEKGNFDFAMHVSQWRIYKPTENGKTKKTKN